MHIYAFGTLFVQLTLGMNAFITAQGFTTFSMVSVLIGAICNITLDPVFIFAFHLGVKGAALATVLSQGYLLLSGSYSFFAVKKRRFTFEICFKSNYYSSLYCTWTRCFYHAGK